MRTVKISFNIVTSLTDDQIEELMADYVDSLAATEGISNVTNDEYEDVEDD